jgi:hypothetical protein
MRIVAQLPLGVVGIAINLVAVLARELRRRPKMAMASQNWRSVRAAQPACGLAL